ncbi:MAG TPA: alanine dehydrogenase [Flavobacterium sp.]|nr:alanine dehydrogenase [Flavobacterium sp.]
MAIINPFSIHELMPQEEKLEVTVNKSDLTIGIPKELYFQEKRVCLTPEAVNTLTNNGHKILIEQGAGKGAGYSDREFSEAGAEVTPDIKKVYASAMILKVEPPTVEEIAMMNTGAFLVSAIQIKTRDKTYFEALQKKKITALGFEFFKDADGSNPMVKSLSEIAGIATIMIASEIMGNPETGKGLLLGNITGVPPTEVVILGSGTVAEYAAKTALGLGANVKIFDNSVARLRRIQNQLSNRVFTSTIQDKLLLKALRRCDVVIGALSGVNRSPIVVTENMVEFMKEGSVIVDVSIDTGGCFETSEVTNHKKPTFIKHGVVHYCVPNIPSRYSKTASQAMSNILIPYLLQIGENGGVESAIRYDADLKNGIYMYHGVLTNKKIADWFGLTAREINLILF